MFEEVALPRRLSADPNHPWFDRLWVPYVEVFVGGERLGCVTAYNVDEGWAQGLVQPFQSMPNGELRTYIARGDVEVRLRGPAPCP